MSLSEKLKPTKTKKLLSLDGGGARSLITIEILSEIERALKKRFDKPEFVLADYFDYVAGTGTGAILATLISMGMSLDDVRRAFQPALAVMFERKSRMLSDFHNINERLGLLLQELVGGDEVTLGTPKLRTLLMMVLRNATTDSPQPFTNNPEAKYNDLNRVDSNLRLPLWRLMRASTASPIYFPPEVIRLHDREYVLVDGALSVYNNPAFLLFLMATTPPYRLDWPRGEDRLQLISIGTGVVPRKDMEVSPKTMNLMYNVTAIPSALMRSAAVEQDVLCRLHSHCVHGGMIDREVGDLTDSESQLTKSFTYARYDVELSYEGLAALGIHDIEPAKVQPMESDLYVEELSRVGAAAARSVTLEQFAGFL